MNDAKSQNAIDDTASTTSTSLLEELRNEPPPMVVFEYNSFSSTTTTKDEAKKKMGMIIKHRSEFPIRLREAIGEASRIASKTTSDRNEEPAPELFLSEVYEAFKSFFFGKRLASNDDEDDDGHGDDNNNIEIVNEESEQEVNAAPFSWWYGLDSDVDTEEEAELAIRMFPSILMEKVKESPLSSMNDCYPIYMLLVCSKALPFIPLLAELGIELGKGRFVKDERAGLTCFMRNVIFNLIHNNVLRDDHDKDESSSEKVDELSAAVMTRLKEKGLLEVMDIYEYDLVEMLLYWSDKKRKRYMSRQQKASKRKHEAKQRFRVLIDLNPSILVECGRDKSLLRHYLHDFLSSTDGCESKERVSLPTFRMIFELGMSHFPKKVGFVFHDTNYELSCEIFGTETVARIVNNELSNSLDKRESTKGGKNLTQDLLVAAVSSSEISLDGVYTLFRRDPMVMLREYQN